jgi:T1SS-143 domain-containing protein
METYAGNMETPVNQISFIITFGENSWIISTAGDWSVAPEDFVIPDGVTHYNVQLHDISIQGEQVFVYVNDYWLKVPNDIVQANTPSTDPSLPDNQSQIASSNENGLQQGNSYFFQTVNRTGDELIAQSGFDTTHAEPSQENLENTVSVDTYAAITAEEDSVCSATGEGEIYNLFGVVDDVEDGNAVNVTVTDSLGNSKTFVTVVINGAWSVPDADLSGLLDGTIIVTADTQDNNGNKATATTDFIKDTLAEITIEVDAGADGIVNRFESSRLMLSGTVNNVEDGQVVTITVTDSLGAFVEFSAIISNGLWQVSTADISSLAEGELTYSASVIDQHCNAAVTTVDVLKDTQAQVTIVVNSNTDVIDNTINAAEVNHVEMLGTVSNIEDGKTIKVFVSDGIQVLTFTTQVVNGSWTIPDSDLSSLRDGNLTFAVGVLDVVGNLAVNAVTVAKDTQAAIEVVIESGNDDFLIAEEVGSLTISGTVTNVEAGQIVTIVLTNLFGDSNTLTAVVNDDLSWSATVDVSSYADGQLNVDVTVQDIAGNVAGNIDTAFVDRSDGIAIFVNTTEDKVDFTLNAAEISQVNMFGLVNNVEDGQKITVTVTDGATLLTFFSTVEGYTWRIEDADLSALDDGTLTYIAKVIDKAGNVATDVTNTLKDTIADITIDIKTEDDTVDTIINAVESTQVDISGEVTGVEDGQTVSLSVTDGNSTLTYSTIITAGNWLIENSDLSTLNDGLLTFVATTADIAGNNTVIETSSVKDSKAQINVSIESGQDEFLLSSEINPVIISGTVLNVEAGRTVTILLSNDAGDTDTLTAIVQGDLTWSTNHNIQGYQDGVITANVSVTDAAGNVAIQEDTAIIDTKDGIAIFVNTFEDKIDTVVNAAESSQVDISGIANNVEDGQTVTVTVTDGISTLTYTTSVNGFIWSIPNNDLTSLNDGLLTYTATVSDVAGNVTNDSVVKVKDTQASITIDVDTNQEVIDDTVSAIEALVVDIKGTVTHVEDGQTVTVTITDGLNSLSFNALVDKGMWLAENSNLSSLNDGTLTYTATVNDKAGNVANNNTTTLKDTQAHINITVDTNSEVTDNTLNTNEIIAVEISGTVSGVEDGQVVTVIASDKVNILYFTSVVVGGVWSVVDADLSSFNDGELTLVAGVIDVVGNLALSSTSVDIDTTASINVQIESGVDEFLTSAEVDPVVISGTVTNVEAGQTVTIVLSNNNGDTATISAVIGNDLSWSASLDISDYQDGPLNVEASVNDIAGNIASNTDNAIIDRADGIAIFVDTFADKIDTIINASEADHVLISGVVNNVEDGQTITVTVSDNITTLTFDTVVNGAVWSIGEQDLTSLQDGALQFTATVTDVAGNIATDSATKAKDTQAAITIVVNTNSDTSDDVINNVESLAVDLSGAVTEIEDGQTVTVSVSDGATTLSYQTVIALGVWNVDNVDISSLIDGNITYQVSVEDKAGNPAIASTTVEKDSQASITVNIDSGDDEFLLAEEITPVNITGTVSNVEVGQVVSILLSNGTGDSKTITATVQNDYTYTVTSDISIYADGELTATANVTDLAGNLATDIDTATIDTTVFIDIDTGVNGLNVAELRANNIDQFEGTTDAEIGQEVILAITDGDFTKYITGTVDVSGHWLVTGVDIAGLDSEKSWQITASVTDLAGNTAIDDMPNIDILRINTIYEVIVDILGSHSDSQTIDIDNADVAFSSDQTSLANLTSDGQSVTVTVADDGQSLSVIRDGDNELVLTVEILLTQIKVKAFKPVDQSAEDNIIFSNNLLETYAVIEAVQTDEDGSSETIILPTYIDIFDAPPLAFRDDYSVIENETSTGSLTGNDFTAEGPLKVTSITVDGNNYVIADGGDTNITLDYGQLTVTSEGFWTFVAANNLDNNALQEFVLTYNIVDHDGSRGRARATFTIEDGQAGSMADVNFTTSEHDIDESTTASFDFTISAGSDTLLAESVVFSDQVIDKLASLNLTSSGLDITYTSSLNKIITALVNGIPVFSLRLDAINDGDDLTATITFNQVRPLDHILEDNILLALEVVAEDLDGTLINSGEIALTIQDGDNPKFSAIGNITLEEERLTAGPQFGSANISTLIGSDNIISVSFINGNKQPALSVAGEAILYHLSDDGKTLTGYTVDIDNPIFVAQLEDNFNDKTDTVDSLYTFTLFQTLDQDISSDIPLKVRVKDFDGDSSTTTLDITIVDDESATIVVPDLVVSEVPVDFSSATNIDLGEIISQSGTDKLEALDFEVSNGEQVLDSNGTPITQNGHSVVWDNVGGGILEAQLADGTVIFNVVIPNNFAQPPATNTVTFTLFDAVDHLSPQNDSLSILIPIALVDQDGTRILDNMQVQIDDGLDPVLTFVDAGAFADEAELVNSSSTDISIGYYDLTEGSDDILAVTLTDGFIFSGVTTSMGSNVSLASTPDADNWYIATADNDDSKVFRIRFNTDETFEYQQFQALIHPDADNTNNLNLLFDIQAVDADGDKSATQSVNVIVKDDVPDSTVIDTAFAEGDLILLDLLPTENQGADGASITKATYLGVDYIVDATDGVTFDLVDDENAEKYAAITIHADGTSTIQSNEFDYPDEHYLDQLTYEVTDNDKDIVTNTLNIDVRDNNGTIIAQNFKINEDESVILRILVNPGDIDLGEEITEIRISIASLNGGTLTLDGNVIPDDGTDYILSGALITHEDGTGFFAEGTARPNGNLEFTPQLNTSDAIDSQKVSIDISTQIVEADNTQKPLITSTIDVSIVSKADLPLWDNGISVFDYNDSFDGSIIEDGGPITITLKADLFDTDGSEVLTFRIENIDEDLTLTYNDGGTQQVSEGSLLTQAQLDTLLATSSEGSAGLMTFDVIAITTEIDNGDSIEHSAQTVSINVQALADKPDLTVKNILSDEDAVINVQDILSGQLNDTDGSESLSFELTLPSGWVLNGLNGATIDDLGANVFSVQSSDVLAGNIELIPLTDISSVSGDFTIDVQAVASDSTIDGVPVSGTETKSDSKTLTVTLKGVIDPPSMVANANWQFDAITSTISNTATLFEDSQVPLDFEIITSDDDGSEIISLTITGLPEGVSLVDGVGDDANLEVVGIESGLPVYSVTPAQLQTLFVKPDKDFSGKITLLITTITTEPDGDSGEYPIELNITLDPVIDETIISLSTTSNGVEDKPVALNFKTLLSADIDGSEEITQAVITNIPAGIILTLDGSEYFGTLDLNVLADSLSLTLVQLLNSNRLGILPPEDASGNYQLSIDYSVEDTSSEGDKALDTFSTTIDINIVAEVDLLTRFVVPLVPLVSIDGSAIDLTGQVGFTDADIDGSEVLDYVVLIFPDSDGWLVTHPNGAIPDGDGRWLIPIDNNLTSDAIQETNKDVLAGVTIISEAATAGTVKVTVAGHVIDQTDQDAIYADFEVRFDDGAANSQASIVDTLQLTTIDANEDQTISFNGHLNTDIAGDGNDVISFRILAADLPQGTSLTGSDLHIVHDATGTRVFEYLFTEASLNSLTLSSAGDDYAGILDIPIRIIATDSISGDTLIDDSQILQIDITPIVDGVTLENDAAMQEDVADSLYLALNFLDADILPSTGGKETILIDSDIDKNLTITLLDGGTLIDSTGLFILKTGTTDTWQFTGTTQAQMLSAFNTLSIQPVQHLAGEDVFSIQVSGNIVDTALMRDGDVSVESTFSEVVTIDVDAVTDPASLISEYSEGDEDSVIDLSSLSAELIDQDGSETLFLTIQGVPTGAIIATDADGVGGTLSVPLVNNGVDGGTFAGQPTYSWTVTQAQLATLVLIPPLDFNGDIPLILQSITKDQSPGEYVTTRSEFIVGVNPIGDGANVYVEPNSVYQGQEDEAITIDLGAISTDSIGDEKIQLTVNIDASSDSSALAHLLYRANIEVLGEKSRFFSNGAGGYVATLTVDSDEISSFDLYLGDLAWGNFNMSVDVATVDVATVNGNEVTNISPVQTFNFDVELEAEVDAPSWISYGDISVSEPDNIALNLEIALQNPAPNEEGFLRVSNLEDGLSLNLGNQQGSDWIVDLADVASLAIIGATSGDNFDLTLTPFSSLGGDTENGATHVITVDVISSPSAESNKPIAQDNVDPNNTDLIDVNSRDQFLTDILDEMGNANQGTELW